MPVCATRPLSFPTPAPAVSLTVTPVAPGRAQYNIGRVIDVSINAHPRQTHFFRSVSFLRNILFLFISASPPFVSPDHVLFSSFARIVPRVRNNGDRAHGLCRFGPESTFGKK